MIALAIVLPLSLGHAAMYGPQAAFFSELFPARVRYSGASLGYQLASVFAGGLSPLLATALLAWGGSSGVAVSLYMIALVLITVVSVGFMKETANSGIGPEVQPSVPVPSPLESPPLVIAAPAIAALPLIVP